ncbi:MAG: hypothetical protein WC381_03825 [Kiritimatiellia bacterium]|jgi:hypothetical protein
MNYANEKRLAARAKALGESASTNALPELGELAHSDSPLVRRLAASALGKLAGIVDSVTSVGLLRPLLSDEHPQVRQYAAKALGAFGTAAKLALSDLDDLRARPGEKDYVLRSVEPAIRAIREALRIAVQQAIHYCRRCGAPVSADEYARAQKAFQRVFCDKCFDEVYLDRRNFDTKVELNKTLTTKSGTLVQSDGERLIADYLTRQGLAYRYDERFRILDGYAIRPDFYLPEFDVYIEYWGMDTADYKIGMLKKQKLYQQEGKRLISIYPEDKAALAEVLRHKLGRYLRMEKDEYSG